MQFIVLNTIKYGDKAFVVQAYSRECGRISLFLRGTGRNSNYRAWMHKLSLMEAELVEREGGMPVIKEMRPVRELCSIRSSIMKGGIAIFISELVLKAVREEEANAGMYAFLTRAVEMLEECREGTANFPVYFMTHFCRISGFAPSDNFSALSRFFSPLLGRFVREDESAGALFAEDLSLLLHKLLSPPEGGLGGISSNGETRYKLAGRLLEYLSMHLGTPIELKSLDILHEICI